MKHHRLLTAIGLLFLGAAVVFVGVDVVVGEDVPDSIVMDVIKGRKKDYKMTFPHKKHTTEFGISACKDCHHKTEEGQTPAPCQKCHDISGPKLDEAGNEIFGLKKAYHKQCKACHKKAAKEGKEKAPVKCGQCHPELKKEPKPPQ